jgi:adenylate cyclase
MPLNGTSAELTLDAIRDCMEGAVPATIATASPAGEPNVAYLSQIEYVDSATLALSFQFFNQTRRNVLANPVAHLVATHPRTGARYRLRIRYRRTETSGPLFERMKAKLAGIASHTGMSGIFRLQGADVYAVEDIEPIECPVLAAPGPRRNLLSAVRVSGQRLGSACDMDALLDCALDCLRREFDIHHALVLMLDAPNARLYTIASMGYEDSGVGSEIPLGHGVVGVAARERCAIRIGHATAEYAYGRAMRETAAAAGLALETEIPLPGLAKSRSQLAVPIEAFGRLVGVLFADSDRDLRFCYDDEDALVALADSSVPRSTCSSKPSRKARDGCRQRGGRPLRPPPRPRSRSATSRRTTASSSARSTSSRASPARSSGRSRQDYVSAGRTLFSNPRAAPRPRIRLPELSDNLEARLDPAAEAPRRTLRPGVRLEKGGPWPLPPGRGPDRCSSPASPGGR